MRSFANMGGESYEYRIELMQHGLCRYLNGHVFKSICESTTSSFIEQVIFLCKNMVNSSPGMSEDYMEQFIPVLAVFFTSSPSLSLEAT